MPRVAVHSTPHDDLLADATRLRMRVMRDEFWNVESQFSTYAIGPGDPQFATPNFGSSNMAVNLAGLFASEKGVGEAARSSIRSLKAAGVSCVLNNFADIGSANVDQTYANFVPENPNPINFLHIGADIFHDFAEQHRATYLRGHFNIAYWAWELSEFPREWEANFKDVDEVWVPSNFTLDAISRVSPVPVVRMPHSLPEWLPIQHCDRVHFGLPQEMFVFLFVFDFASASSRKNPLGLIQAFKSAFGTSDKAMLVLKSSHGNSDPITARQIADASADANIRIIDTVLPRPQVNALLALCDCYVSLHRSEGFGLTIAEAMSLGKPVIATNYSGNTDFMNADNSFPVRYKLTDIQHDQGQYRKGCVWAEPDVDHAAKLMRLVYDNREQAAQIGRRARRDIIESLHPRVVGDRMKARLERASR